MNNTLLKNSKTVEYDALFLELWKSHTNLKANIVTGIRGLLIDDIDKSNYSQEELYKIIEFSKLIPRDAGVRKVLS